VGPNQLGSKGQATSKRGYYTQIMKIATDVIAPTSSSKMVLVSVLAWACMVSLVTLAIVEFKAPAPLPATAAQNEFSAVRAMDHIRVISRVPHPMGSSAGAEVRKYLFTQMSALGLNPQILDSTAVHDTSRQIIIARTHDIVGRMPGSSSSGAVMLMAHYDSVYRAPGAADDTAGVAAILEAVRALRAGPALNNDLIVLFTDGEENGLLGAEAFADSNPWMKEIGLVLNFDARGDRGPSLLFQTSAHNGGLIKAVARVVPHPIGSSLLYSLSKLLPNDTDYSVFRTHNVPGLNFAFGERLEAYHSRLDTIDNLSEASLQHHGSYALSLSRYFGSTDLSQLQQQGRDAIFFDWLGSSLIAYSEAWVIPGQILMTLLLICTIFLGILRSNLKIGRLMLAMIPILVILSGVPVVMAAAEWALSRASSLRITLGDLPANSYLLTGMVLIGACAGSALFSIARKRFTLQELSFSSLVLACLLSWLLAIFLPGGSYLFFWPLLMVLIGHLIVQLIKAPGDGAQSLANLPGAATAILLFTPISYLLYVFLTLQLLTIVAIGFLLSLFLVLSVPFIHSAIPRNGIKAISLTLFISAAAMIGIGFKLSHYSPEHPQPDSIVYSLNADNHQAIWISYDQSVDNWTSQFFLQKPPLRKPMPDYLNGLQRPVLSAPAPLMDMGLPSAEIKGDKQEGNLHNIQMSVRSQRNAGAVYINFDNNIQLVSVRFESREIAVHHNAGPFSIVLLGMEDQSVGLDLTLNAQAGSSFWLMDRSYGLPSGTRARPDDFMAGEGSDITLICRKYSL